MARNFTNWLRGYAHYTRHSEAPDIFHFWTGVFTIAGALRRQVWIDQRHFQWTPNFWIVLVAPAGIVNKSTSLGIGTELLREVPGIHFGPRSITWQGLTTSLEDASEMVPFDDGYRTMSCVTCAVKELGTFLRTNDPEMIDVLTDLWDGQIDTWERRTRAVESRVSIVNPWVNIMGCTTPSWLRANFTEGMIGGGMASRIIFVYSDKPRQIVAYPADQFPLEEFAEEKKKLIEDLIEISNIRGEYTLSSEAKEWGVEWYREVKTRRPEHMISERFGGYIARKQTHVHKLALVLAAAQRSERIIELSDLQIAAQMMTGLEASMHAVFDSIGNNETSKNAIEVLTYVRAYGEIHQKALWRHLYNMMSTKDFEEATSAAIKAGYIRIVQRGNELIYQTVKQEP